MNKNTSNWIDLSNNKQPNKNAEAPFIHGRILDFNCVKVSGSCWYALILYTSLVNFYDLINQTVQTQTMQVFQLKQHLKMDGRNTGFFWDGIFSGAMLVSGRVSIPMYSLTDWVCAIVNSVFF